MYRQMVEANKALSLSQMAWYDSWQPPGVKSAFIK